MLRQKRGDGSMISDVLSLIRTNMDGFSKRQRVIANYILNNYEKAADRKSVV